MPALQWPLQASANGSLIYKRDATKMIPLETLAQKLCVVSGRRWQTCSPLVRSRPSPSKFCDA